MFKFLIKRSSFWLFVGLGLTATGGMSAAYWERPAEVMMAVGLTIEYFAMRPALAKFRNDVGPGRHRQNKKRWI